MKRVALLLALIAGLLAASPAVAQTTGFGFVCESSGTGPYDPIVHPGEYDSSHQHEFFGGDVQPDSTRETLLSAATGCHYGDSTEEIGDHSGYWVPSLYRSGVRVEPYNANVYYLKPRGESAGEVRATPQGLEIIAGVRNHGRRTGSSNVTWGCTDQRLGQGLPEDCASGKRLKVSVNFPSCARKTDAGFVQRDSVDHRAHLSYPRDSGCPETHPIPIPKLKITVRYPTRDASNLALSSGPTGGMHADFLEALEEPLMDDRLSTCMNMDVRCGLNGEVR